MLKVGCKILRVDLRLARRACGQELDEALRQSRDLSRLAGHECVRLDVKREVVRRPLRPEFRRGSLRQRVIRGIHFHHAELGRVVPESRFRGGCAPRVEDVRADHGGVRPRRRADTYLSAARPGERFADDLGGSDRECVVGAPGGGDDPRIVRRFEVGCGPGCSGTRRHVSDGGGGHEER